MELFKKFVKRIDDDFGYDNEKLARDLQKIAEEHQAEQLLQTGVIKSFYCNSDATLEKRCDKQCSWCNSYEMIME